MSYVVPCTGCGVETTQHCDPERLGILVYCQSCRPPHELVESGAQRDPDCGSTHPDIAAVLAGEKRWCVIEADCLSVLPTIGRVDHVITDPPYEAEAHTKGRRGRRGGSFKETPLHFGPMDESTRLSIGQWISERCARWSIVFSQVEATQKWADAVGGYVRTMVWVKDTTTPQMTGDRPGMGWECMVACHSKGRKRWNGGGRSGVFHGPSVVKMGTPNDHETQKPLSLMIELVDLFTDIDDLILDPFAGSGTTGLAAVKRGRRAVLIERDPKYASLCRERLESEDESSTIDARRAGQVPLFRRTG